ncbi:MAG: putative selenium-dependent hydroxylase accessory protein YqeC [Gemmatimonadetes bacterium]|nr:putative selenium-dependent hydroxylase accessory protein YqeC [Gemmatimonadota bacterium]
MTSLAEALGIRSGVVCVVGAGGKKTLLYRLAHELPGRIALTTTVLSPPFARHVDQVIVVEHPLPLVARLREEAHPARIVGIARPSEKHNRWAGLTREEVDSLADLNIFDTILVKADGARSRWIKVPGPEEPIIPSSATAVTPIVSAKALGQPLDETTAHHPERIAELAGAKVGDRIEPEHVAALLSSPEGALKDVGKALVVPLINMVDDDAARASAMRTAERALERTNRFERVLLTSLTAPEPVVAIVERR